jgi:hypothetical protein
MHVPANSARSFHGSNGTFYEELRGVTRRTNGNGSFRVMFRKVVAVCRSAHNAHSSSHVQLVTIAHEPADLGGFCCYLLAPAR